MSAFLCGKTKFSKEGAVYSRKIASWRIHVQRAIERLRNYKILDYINAPLRPFADKIVQVFTVLVNLQTPIIAGIIKDYNELLETKK